MLPIYTSNKCAPVSSEEAEAARFIMGTLGVLLIIALFVGEMTGQFGIAFWCAIVGWIPAVILIGGIADWIKTRQRVHHS